MINATEKYARRWLFITGHFRAYGSMPPCLRDCPGLCVSHPQKDHLQRRTRSRQHHRLLRARLIRIVSIFTNDYPPSPFVKSIAMQSMLRIVVGRASLTVPGLVLVHEAVNTAADRQEEVPGRAVVAPSALIPGAASRINAQTIPYEVPHCCCS